MPEGTTIYTIGHSNHTVDAFIVLLQQHGIHCLVDVRSQPYSRYNPQFNRESLMADLHQVGIEYAYLGQSLGGRPDQQEVYEPGSERPNYSQQRLTPLYQQGLRQLERQARIDPTAIMCSEGAPDTCHRTLLITPSLLDLGFIVQHILPDGRLRLGEKPFEQLGFGF